MGDAMEHKTVEECRMVVKGSASWVPKDGKCSACGYVMCGGIDATNAYCDSLGVWDCPRCEAKGTFSSVHTNQELGWRL